MRKARYEYGCVDHSMRLPQMTLGSQNLLRTIVRNIDLFRLCNGMEG